MTNKKNRQIIAGKIATVTLLALLAMFLCFTLGKNAIAANSDNPQNIGNNQSSPGVFIHAGQIGDDIFGLYVVDYENKTIAVYRYVDRAKPNRLELRAVRSFKYDVQLDAYNTAEPSPAKVRKIVSQQKRLGADK